MSEYHPKTGCNSPAFKHFVFCRRQWALICRATVGGKCATAEGRIMHDRADDPFFAEKRGDVIDCPVSAGFHPR